MGTIVVPMVPKNTHTEEDGTIGEETPPCPMGQGTLYDGTGDVP